jgi:RNA polymerase sigma factor (TIGR02999 family)
MSVLVRQRVYKQQLQGLSVNSNQAADVTKLLLAWNKGDRDALDLLMPVVYDELRRLARRYMRSEAPGHTLQATALVNDAYIRLVDQTRVNWQNRAQFFGVAAQIIRRVLVDHARARHRLKRGGDAVRVELNEGNIATKRGGMDIIALDDVLNRLANMDPQKCQIIELRFFGGLSIEETARALNISPATIKRQWAFARSWLYKEMTSR